MAIGGITGFLHGGWGFRGLGRPGEWGTATSQKPFRANFRIGDNPDRNRDFPQLVVRELPVSPGPQLVNGRALVKPSASETVLA
jgi:hypothetical protein